MALYAFPSTAQVKEGILVANRNWASGGKIYSMHVSPVIITATAQIGASGAVTSFVGSAVLSLARQSTGVYKLTCQSQTSFSRLYAAQASLQSPPSGLSGILAVEIQNAPNAAVATASGATLTVKCLDAAGALADPASGSALNIMFMASQSSVTINGE